MYSYEYKPQEWQNHNPSWIQSQDRRIVIEERPRTPSKAKQCCRGFIASVVNCWRDFCNDTSIHGFNHIAAPRRHWIERVLWISVCCLAIWGALNVSLGQLQRYNESPTVVTLEKDFRTWKVNMPAVTICYQDRMNMAKLPYVIKKHFGIEVHDEQYAYYTRFINAVVNSDLFHLGQFEEFKTLDTPVDMFQIAVDVMPDADIKTVPSDLSVTWTWWPVMTEAGACHITNSLASADVAIVKRKPNETAPSPMMCKYSANNCYVMFDVKTSANYYIHSPYDVMDLISSVNAFVFLALTRVTELSIMETGCGRGVKELHPKRRRCLYTDEPTGEGKQVYSTNSCRLSCRSKLAKKLCGCIPFYYFYEGGPLCTPAGMWCLSSHSQTIASNNNEKCPCEPQCVDSVFKEISTVDNVWYKTPFNTRGSAKFVVQSPRTRYTREIVFHFQDLVVSFGGAAGLFLGASFISFVEILYFFLARMFSGVVKKDEKTQKIVAKKVKVPNRGHEAVRLKELTAVLDSQKKYEHNGFTALHY